MSVAAHDVDVGSTVMSVFDAALLPLSTVLSVFDAASVLMDGVSWMSVAGWN